MQDEEPTVPDPQRVTKRALVLAALTCRGSIESGADDPEAESVHQDLLHWFDAMPLDSECSEAEAETVHAALGSLKEEQAFRAMWTVEGLVILSWALKQRELPPHDTQIDPYGVTETVGLLNPEADLLSGTAELRSPEEIAACREFYYAIHARVRGFLRSPGQSSQHPFQEWLDPKWLDLLKLPVETLVIDNELMIGGESAWKASRDQLVECEQIILERHRAAIWLAGEEVCYWHVRVDT